MKQLGAYTDRGIWHVTAIRDDNTQVDVPITPELAGLMDTISAIVERVKTHQEQQAVDIFRAAEKHLDDQQAAEFYDLIPVWAEGESIEVGQLRKVDGKVYRAKEAHVTRQEPAASKGTAKWTALVIGKTAGLNIIDWYEPDATHNYMLGELVRMEDGTIWESLIQGNDMSPVTFPGGWTKREDLENNRA